LREWLEVASEGLTVGQRLQVGKELELAATKCLLYEFQKSATEAREHPHGQEEAGPASHPVLTVCRDAAARDHAVQVWMGHQVLAPGMQHGEEADLGTQVLGIGRDGAQGIGCGSKEQVVDDSLVLISDRGDLLRECEDDVEVRTVQKLGLSIFDPLSPCERLTLWAMPVATAVVSDAPMLAGIASLNVAAERSGAASRDRLHDAPLRNRQRPLVLSTIGLTVAAEDIRHFELRTLHERARLEVLGHLGRLCRRQRMRQKIQRTSCGADFVDRQTQIPRGRGQTAMSHQQLDCAQVSTILEQVDREGVPQTVRRDWFGEPTALQRQLACLVDTSACDM